MVEFAVSIFRHRKTSSFIIITSIFCSANGTAQQTQLTFMIQTNRLLFPKLVLTYTIITGQKRFVAVVTCVSEPAPFDVLIGTLISHVIQQSLS